MLLYVTNQDIQHFNVYYIFACYVWKVNVFAFKQSIDIILRFQILNEIIGMYSFLECANYTVIKFSRHFMNWIKLTSKDYNLIKLNKLPIIIS